MLRLQVALRTLCGHNLLHIQIKGQNSGYVLGVPIMRTRVFGGLYAIILGNFQLCYGLFLLWKQFSFKVSARLYVFTEVTGESPKRLSTSAENPT